MLKIILLHFLLQIFMQSDLLPHRLVLIYQHLCERSTKFREALNFFVKYFSDNSNSQFAAHIDDDWLCQLC